MKISLFGAGTCFGGDTYVRTPRGRSSIRDIRVGDLVLARSEITGEQDYRRVIKTYEHEVDEVYLVGWDIPSVWEDTGMLHCSVVATGEHPFWIRNKGWVEVRDLQLEDKLQICDPAPLDDCFRELHGLSKDFCKTQVQWASITTLEKLPRNPFGHFVHNLDVEDFHTYFVGLTGAWVHAKAEMPNHFAR
ncbi:polymorphic toxin-type HINT domain-containing protein [Chitinimonas sp.]|uniref:polymorphic toxin-type HINT domain-containing protein n=1 Tax=Chitinimonas sp. TaxID=1934313 RepID=UPI0035B34C17